MTRTIKKHEDRRKEILEKARELFYSKGYDNTSIQDLLDAVGIAKGTFYHYFKSKEELLDSLINSMSEQIVAGMKTLDDNSNLNGLQKLNKLFEMSGQYKLKNKDLIVAYVHVMHKPENMVLHQKSTEAMTKLVSPILSRIIVQGVKEGHFNTPYPEEMGEFIMSMSVGLQHSQGKLILESTGNPESINKLERMVRLFEDSVNKILGAAPGSVIFVNEDLLKEFISIMKGGHHPPQSINE